MRVRQNWTGHDSGRSVGLSGQTGNGDKAIIFKNCADGFSGIYADPFGKGETAYA